MAVGRDVEQAQHDVLSVQQIERAIQITYPRFSREDVWTVISHAARWVGTAWRLENWAQFQSELINEADRLQADRSEVKTPGEQAPH
jgi:hypothetical protein